MRSTTKTTVAKARALRRIMTKPEAALWQVLRAGPAGLKFRRQHPVGPFVLDFYCPSAGLAVEADGASHDMGANPSRDERRDEWLHARGFTVMRFSAADVLTNMEAVVRHVVEACASLSSLSRSDGERNCSQGGGGATGAASPSTGLRPVPLPTPPAQGGQ